jgi:hypothetical protein
METVYKRNALVVLGLAIAFLRFFMFMKHHTALRNVIPFAEDPYDALGSFAVVVSGLAALISLVRAFWPYGPGAASGIQRMYTVRAQLTVVFCVMMTLLADFVAMMRHLPMWIEADSRNLLLILFCMMVLGATAVFVLVAARRPFVWIVRP